MALFFTQQTAEKHGKLQKSIQITSGISIHIQFLDSLHGWFTDESSVYQTDNGGREWEKIYTLGPEYIGNSEYIQSFYFATQDTGWIVGDDGLIKRTTNNGKTWYTQYIGPKDQQILSTHFTDTKHGVLVGSAGTIYYTENGGESWIDKSINTKENFNSMCFVSKTTGYIAGSGGTLYKTVDGGRNWNQLNKLDAGLTSIYFENTVKGWVVGNSGFIANTIDGGETWVTQINNISNNLNSVFFIDESKGWAVGDGGTILKTDNGGIDFVETLKMESNKIPEEIILQNNYPNPFNLSTSISYQLLNSCFLTVTVYNEVGKKIATIADGWLKKGLYSLSWNAKNYPSGIYMIHFKTNTFHKTIKVLLQK
jgi:photosystem II stability/assembly factor-like uncharacterized protein